MKTELIRILTTSLLCGLIDLMTPPGEREGLRRAVRLLTGLFLLSVMLAPLLRLGTALDLSGFVGWVREREQQAEEEYARMMEEKLTLCTLEQLEEGVYDLLSRRLGIAREDVTVAIETVGSGETLAVSHIRILVRGGAILQDPRQIEALVEEAVGCVCTVAVGYD